jgi:hypothetical protein
MISEMERARISQPGLFFCLFGYYIALHQILGACKWWAVTDFEPRTFPV